MITSIFVTRIIFFGLGEEYYGFWALLWTVFGYALLLDFGFGKTIQKYTAEVSITNDFDKYNKIISAVICTYMLIGLLIIVLSIFGGMYLDKLFAMSQIADLDYCKFAFTVFGFGVALTFPTGFLAEMLVGLKRMDLNNYALFITYTLKVIGIYIAYRLGLSIIPLIWITVATGLLNNVILYFIVKKLMPKFKISLFNFKIQNVKEIASFSLFAYIYAITVMIIFRTDAIVLGVMMGMGAVGIYQIGTRIPIIFESVTTQFQNTLPALAASLHKEGQTEKLKWILLKSNRFAAYLATGVYLLLIFQLKQILYLWLDITDPEAVTIGYIMLSSAYVIVLFRSASIKYMQMAGQHKKVAIIMSVECLLNIGFSITLVSIIGTVGVAWGTLIPNLFFSIFVIFPMFAKFGNFSKRYYLQKVYGPVFLTSIPLIIFLVVINHFFPAYEWNFLELLVWMAVGGIIYLLIGFFFFFNADEKERYMGMIPGLRKIIK
jgi:O-antigen/teichoic acid export membrane protein